MQKLKNIIFNRTNKKIINKKACREYFSAQIITEILLTYLQVQSKITFFLYKFCSFGSFCVEISLRQKSVIYLFDNFESGLTFLNNLSFFFKDIA